MQSSPASNTPSTLWVQNFIATVLRYTQHGRLMVILFAIGMLLSIAYYVFGTPLYFSRSLVRVTFLGLPVHADSGKDDSANANSGAMVYRGLMQHLESGTMQLRVAQRLGYAGPEDAPETVRTEVLPLIRLEFVDADTLQVSVYSPYPEIVQKYTPTLIEVYDEMEAEVREEFRSKALATYLQELDEVRAKLDQQLKTRMGYEEDNSLAKLFLESNQLTSVPKDIIITKEQMRKMGEIRNQLQQGGEQMDTLAKLSLLSAFKLEKPTEVGSVVRDPAGTLSTLPAENSRATQLVVQPSMITEIEPWQKLEIRLREVKAEIERKSAMYRPGHDIMVALAREQVELEDKLRAELNVAMQRFEVEGARLGEKLKDLELKLPEYHKVTAEYERSRQDYQLREKGQLEWDKAHNQLATTIAKLQFGQDKDRLQMRFMAVETLRDKDPVSPSKFKLAIFGLALSLGLALGVPMLVHLFDTSASRIQQIEAATGVRGIGVIPLTSKFLIEQIFRSPVIDAKVPNFLLEAFRVIRSHILLNPNKTTKRSQVIMVTSARPSEGKSSMASNLAWAFYSMGERTLLVDCDLRRGRIGMITDTPTQIGMSNLLTGRATEMDAVMRTESDKLDVIPRGPIIAGSTDILCQATFLHMIEDWRTKYDRIILDTPPVLGLSETIGIQAAADGVLLVVRAHSTRFMDVTAAVENLKKAGAHIYGFVLNAVDLSKLTNHYYYYYYSPTYYEEFETGVSKGPHVATA